MAYLTTRTVISGSEIFYAPTSYSTTVFTAPCFVTPTPSSRSYSPPSFYDTGFTITATAYAEVTYGTSISQSPFMTTYESYTCLPASYFTFTTTTTTSQPIYTSTSTSISTSQPTSTPTSSTITPSTTVTVSSHTTSTTQSRSTTTPCLPSYGYFTETVTGFSRSGTANVPVTATYTYTAIYDPSCAFGA